MKKVVEEKPQFVGINLERPDDVVIDVDDEERLTRIVSVRNIGFNCFKMKKMRLSQKKMISDNDLLLIYTSSQPTFNHSASGGRTGGGSRG